MTTTAATFGDARLDLDVAIIGAGISGINMGQRLKSTFGSQLRFTIYEARSELGGTWSLFQYPGTRSDSDLYTFGFPWKAWQSDNPIADKKQILDYLKESVKEAGLDSHIVYMHRLMQADWGTEQQAWTLSFSVGQDQTETQTLRARLLVFGTGYYNYASPLPAVIPGLSNFRGQVVHPQMWPKELDYKNKDIVVIGSGATAITLLPNLAKHAKSVTMLQRSPSYILSLPTRDATAGFLQYWLPSSWSHSIMRMLYIVRAFLFFKFCRAFPVQARKAIQKRAKLDLPKDFPISPHFEPLYDPWSQRVCFSPDGDFFKALKESNTNIVTGKIKTVTESGIELEASAIPSATLSADILVTATGLRMGLFGKTRITRNGESIECASKFTWKGQMLQDVPNLTIMIGYTAASWTLGAEATAQNLLRLLKRMRQNGLSSITPRAPDGLQPQNLMNLTSSYVVAAQKDLPKAGSQYPWLPRNAYLSDIWEAKHGNLLKDLETRRMT